MVVGRTEAACAALVAQLSDRSMSRRYLAMVRGTPALQASIDLPIGRDPRLRTRMAVVEGPGGKRAVTHVARLAQGTLGDSRSRWSSAGCRRAAPIRSGFTFRGSAIHCRATRSTGATDGIGRQALHAWSLGLRHPRDGRVARWHRPPPPDLLALARAAGIDLEGHYDELVRADD
jgi:23S rRNA pseudouridine1911/1915/1917 synthase